MDDMRKTEKAAMQNRARVKKFMENRDRINLILPKGTIERINGYGLKTSEFARKLILAELERMDQETGKSRTDGTCR